MVKSVPPLQVLIADDDVDAAEALAMLLPILCARPLEVMVASEGRQALRLATGALRPQAVILDIEMPLLDGFQIAREVRRLLGPPAPALIAVSGHVGHVQVAGEGELFDHAFRKPVDPDERTRLLLDI